MLPKVTVLKKKRSDKADNATLGDLGEHLTKRFHITYKQRAITKRNAALKVVLPAEVQRSQFLQE